MTLYACLYNFSKIYNTEWANGYDISSKYFNQTTDGKTEKLERLNKFMYKDRSIGVFDPASKSLPTYHSWSLSVSLELLTM
jgi:hypothetical protein